MEKLKRTAIKIYKFTRLITGNSVSIYAAQAAFFLIISAIPFLLLVFTLMKSFLPIDKSAILHTINSFAPAEISRLLSTVIEELFGRTASASVISVSAVSTLWLASRGVMALGTGLENVYHIPKRNYFYSRILSVLYTLAFLAALMLTIVFFIFGSRFEAFIGKYSAFLALIFNFLLHGKIFVFIYLTLIFALAYKFLPKNTSSFRSQLLGASFAAIGWIAFSFIYSIYIENFSNYSYVYGSLAAAVFLMLWLYFCMNIFLYGAQINKLYKKGFFSKNTTRF